MATLSSNYQPFLPDYSATVGYTCSQFRPPPPLFLLQIFYIASPISMTYGPQDRTLTKACRQWALLNVQLIADLPPNLLREVHLSVCNHINETCNIFKCM